MDAKKISDKVMVGAQPSAEELADLRARGFVTVVNLRTEGEKNQPLLPGDEGAHAQAVGLSYHHIPVSLSNLRVPSGFAPACRRAGDWGRASPSDEGR